MSKWTLCGIIKSHEKNYNPRQHVWNKSIEFNQNWPLDETFDTCFSITNRKISFLKQRWGARLSSLNFLDFFDTDISLFPKILPVESFGNLVRNKFSCTRYQVPWHLWKMASVTKLSKVSIYSQTLSIVDTCIS